jgi:hypothetical protein
MPQRQASIAPASAGQLPERRRQVRQLALLRVALLHAGGVSDICVVRNVSANGLSARVYRPMSTGEAVEIEFRSGERVSGRVVWVEDGDLGIVVPEPIDVAAVLASRWCREEGRRRALPRIAVDCNGRLSTGLRTIDVVLRDISQGGASLELPGGAPEMSNVELLLPDLRTISGVVRWREGAMIGVSFNECIAFEPLARWIQARREGLGLGCSESSAGSPPAIGGPLP